MNAHEASQPRCALLLYGLPKFFATQSYPSIVKHVTSRMRIPVDVFVHTYDLCTTTNPRNGEYQCVINPNEIFTSAPLKWCIESQERVDADLDHIFNTLTRFGDAWHNNFVSLRNALRQYHSISSAHAIMDMYVQETHSQAYTTVIASRMDMLYIDDIDETLVDCNIAARDVYLPDFHEFGGVNDRFAIGGADAMRDEGHKLLLVLDKTHHVRLYGCGEEWETVEEEVK